MSGARPSARNIALIRSRKLRALPVPTLKMPDTVGLAMDPEWRLGPKEKPLRQIDDLRRDRNLPIDGKS